MHKPDEYPKMIYRRGSMIEVEGVGMDTKIVHSLGERQACRGWYDTPTAVMRHGRFVPFLKGPVKAWVQEWRWLLEIGGAVLAVVFGALVNRFM